MIKIIFGEELETHNFLMDKANNLDKICEDYKEKLKEKQQNEISRYKDMMNSQQNKLKDRIIKDHQFDLDELQFKINNLKTQLTEKDKTISNQRDKITKLVLDIDKLQKVLK